MRQALLFLLLALPAAHAGFEEAACYSDRHGGQALLVWERGILRERFADGWSRSTPANVQSITKSLTALAWLSAFSPDATVPLPNNRRLPAAALLSQSSGLESGRLYGKGVQIDRSLKRVRFSPSRGFDYGPSHWEVLGAEMLRQGRSTESFLHRLGIRAAGWQTDRTGRPYFSAGARLSASGLLRAGRLVLDEGRFGWATLIPKQHLRAALQPSHAFPVYGGGFWLNAAAGNPRVPEADIESLLRGGGLACLSHRAPRDLVAMAGSGGHRVYIIPSRRMVVVRLGRPAVFQDPAFLAALFN